MEEKKSITKKCPKNSLCFSEAAEFRFTEDGGDPIMEMTAYSGKPIKGHWYWGTLAIDLSGMKFAKKVNPILSEHDIDKKIGFANYVVTEDYKLVAKNAKVLDTPFAQEFVANSKAGFPYEASIFAKPSKIEEIMEGSQAEVNGYVLKGPAVIWRESAFKEGSVVTFGADPNTKSVAMSENEDMEVEVTTFKGKVEEVPMTKDQLKAEFPDIYAAIYAEGKTEAEVSFSAEKTSMSGKITSLEAENAKLKETGKTQEDRLKELEKNDALRSERELKASADAIVENALSAHKEIPVRLHTKIKKQISHEAFIENGNLDKVKFAASVETELKDWAPVEGEGPEPSILGMGFSASSEKVHEMAEDKIVERMMGY
jgi:hypothetical protein